MFEKLSLKNEINLFYSCYGDHFDMCGFKIKMSQLKDKALMSIIIGHIESAMKEYQICTGEDIGWKLPEWQYLNKTRKMVADWHATL